MGFRSYLDFLGNRIEERRLLSKSKISSRADLIEATNKVPGLYWIETDMPISEIIKSIKEVSGVSKHVRKTKPNGVGFTQIKDGFQIIYSGTENDLQKRLLEHLFNEGDPGTAKLSINLHHETFNRYNWYLSTAYIKGAPSRYALEIWWREKVGWPPLCRR